MANHNALPVFEKAFRQLLFDGVHYCGREEPLVIPHGIHGWYGLNQIYGCSYASANAMTLAHGARQEADTFEKRLGVAERKTNEADSHVSEALRRVIDTTAELDRAAINK